MRRLIIGVLALGLGGWAAPADDHAQAKALLALAIERAGASGGPGFRLRCEAGCVQPRRTLKGLSNATVVKAGRIACPSARSAVCYALELEKESPKRWFTVRIETRPDAVRPIARVTLFGP